MHLKLGYAGFLCALLTSNSAETEVISERIMLMKHYSKTTGQGSVSNASPASAAADSAKKEKIKTDQLIASRLKDFL